MMRFGWVSLLLLLQLSLARKLSGKVTFSDSKALVGLGKFGCSIGDCRYDVRARVIRPLGIASVDRKLKILGPDARPMRDRLLAASVPLRLRIFTDETHPETKTSCVEMDKSKTSVRVSVAMSGNLGEQSHGELKQVARPHQWHFYLENCNQRIQQELATIIGEAASDIGPITVAYEVNIYQTDHTHLSHEYVGMMKWHFLQLFTATGLLAYIIRREVKIMKHQEHRLHVVPIVLNAAVALNILSALWQIIFILGMKAGRLWLLVSTLSETFSIISQTIVCGALTLVVYGVTLNAPQRLSTPQGWTMLLGIAAIHGVIILVGQLAQDPFKDFAQEGFLGWLTFLLRLGLWVSMVAAWRVTKNDSLLPRSTKHFLQRIIYPVSFYMLAFPLLLLITKLVIAPYVRHTYYYNLSFFMQCVGMLAICEAFLTKGEYFQVSVMSRNLLPGGFWAPEALRRMS